MSRNWLLKAGLGVVSAAIAAIGVFGWLYRANAFAALGARDAALLAGMWPFYAAAAIGCLASQVVVACCGANFHRPAAPRTILVVGIIVFAAFSTVGAENGWMIATGAEQRAAASARSAEREALRREIAALGGQIAAERARLPDPATTPAARQAEARDTFLAATRDASTRLPVARAELDARPPLSSERARTWADVLMMLAFLAYQLLEPWLYYAAEPGRRADSATILESRIVEPIPKSAPKLTEELTPPPSANVSTLRPRSRRPRAAGMIDADVYATLRRVT
ncbi:MAG: hypothetical protein KGL39_38100 [Patescibacteria group bacterium]|nr:hypothetical protein [Patescibacteria group bacterium]